MYLSIYLPIDRPVYRSTYRSIAFYRLLHIYVMIPAVHFLFVYLLHFYLPICRFFFIRQFLLYLYWCSSKDLPWTYLSNLFCIYTMTQMHIYTDLAVCLHAYMPAHLHACIGLLILMYA